MKLSRKAIVIISIVSGTGVIGGGSAISWNPINYAMNRVNNTCTVVKTLTELSKGKAIHRVETKQCGTLDLGSGPAAQKLASQLKKGKSYKMDIAGTRGSLLNALPKVDKVEAVPVPSKRSE